MSGLKFALPIIGGIILAVIVLAVTSGAVFLIVVSYAN